jgi:hypothetical protein
MDTCIINKIFEEGYYIWEGELPDGVTDEEIDPELQALRAIFQVNQRASFQWLISPLSVAELANVQDFVDREQRVRWILDVLDHWLIMLDEIEDRSSQGGTVRHRFKLCEELQSLEANLMKISDFRRDPFDRLLLVQYRMGNCDAFMTLDQNTIWRHREELKDLGILVLRPTEFWDKLKPWAALWF